MGHTACTEPQCLYKGAHYLYLTVELYLYSPYGPYGLYRALVPVQGCTLPYLNLAVHNHWALEVYSNCHVTVKCVHVYDSTIVSIYPGCSELDTHY